MSEPYLVPNDPDKVQINPNDVVVDVQTDGDTNTFYEAMITIWKLHQKYSRK